MEKKSNVISIVTPVILDRMSKIKAAKKKEKDWVNVSYEQKELAKRVGCKWCPVEKKWYASSYMSSMAVENWLAEQAEKMLKRK